MQWLLFSALLYLSFAKELKALEDEYINHNESLALYETATCSCCSDCDRCFGTGGYCPWGPWTTCTSKCGGGTQSRCRYRYYSRITCRSYRGDDVYQSCNEICFNGGTYSSSNCACPTGTKGDCCECQAPAKCKTGSSFYSCESNCTSSHVCTTGKCLECINDTYYIHHVTGQCEDPCNDATIVRNDYRRSVNYTAGSEGEDQSNYICDRFLDEGWYIFDSLAGNKMPTFAPDLYKCGTESPIWLNGQHPTVEEGVVTRQACAKSFSGSCYVSHDIQIKNCGERFAYYLTPTKQSCSEAYCIGEEVKCPIGESSDTGFTPGCTKDGFPTLTEEPVISFRVDVLPENGLREVVMLCNVTHDESEILLDVKWIMGDLTVLEQSGGNAIAYSNLPAELHEADWSSKAKLDTLLRCEVRPRYNITDVPGAVRFAEYYMGFEVENTELIVAEGGEPANYTFRPTIPILCPQPTDQRGGCTLPINVREPYVNDHASTCNNTLHKQTSIEFKDAQHCQVDIPMILNPNENSTYTIPVYGSMDSTYDGTAVVKLVLRTAEYHSKHAIWQNYSLPDAFVTVYDNDHVIEKLYCEAHNDPHFITFDGRRYDYQEAGEFVLYKHKFLPIEIHVYFQAKGTYSGVCGAAIRSGGDLFIYDKCRLEKPLRVRLYECEDHNLRISGDSSGNYIIELVHGTRVYIRSGSVKIIPSLGDLHNVVGLCGQFDRRCDNEFRDGNGDLILDDCYPHADCSNISSCKRNDQPKFGKSWKVKSNESLYQGVIPTPLPKPDTIYCSCACVDGKNETLCKMSKSPDFCIEGGDDGQYKECLDRFIALRDNSGTDNIVDHVGPFEYDPDFNPPAAEWKDPWNEQTATAECESFMSKLQGIDVCTSVANVTPDEVIDACVEDIKITGGTAFLVFHANRLLSTCLIELRKNMSNFIFNNETGKLEFPTELTENLCDVVCLNNGTCKNGFCECAEGFFGTDCFFDEKKIPLLYGIPQKGMCDTRTRPCQKTPVTGHYFIDTPSLSCHMTPVLVGHNGTLHFQNEVKTKPEFDHYERVMCPIPLATETEGELVLGTGYIITVSNDGLSQSNSKHVLTYDSLCMDCSSNFTCFQKSATCFIESNCYVTGASAPNEPCRICDPTTSVYSWSDECPSNIGFIVGLTILAVAIVSLSIGAGVVVYKKKKPVRVHSTNTSNDQEMKNNSMDR